MRAWFPPWRSPPTAPGPSAGAAPPRAPGPSRRGCTLHRGTLSVHQWDVEGGDEVASFEMPQEMFDAQLTLSCDGSRGLSWTNALVLWELRTGKPLRRFEGHEGGTQRAVFSPD